MDERKKTYEDRRKWMLNRRSIDSNGCWIWTGSINTNGYGICGFGKFFASHRAAFILWKGEIPKGKMVLHKCDIKACFNPDHLYIGDAKQNAKDALERNLFPRGPNHKKANKGTKNGKAKLSEAQVKAIRKEYFPYLNSMRTLAKKYKVNRNHIASILKGTSWKHI